MVIQQKCVEIKIDCTLYNIHPSESKEGSKLAGLSTAFLALI